MTKTSNMDELDIIIALENEGLEIVDIDDWKAVKNVAEQLSICQGFYGRLLESMRETETLCDLNDMFPIYM